MAGLGVTSSGWPAARLFARQSGIPAYFGLHPFIEAHPEAVFIRKTAVAAKGDSQTKRQEAFQLARRIFTLRDTPGIEASHKFAIKPNLTMTGGTGLKYAIVTDPYVVEGLIDGMKQVDIRAQSIYVREGVVTDQVGTGYHELAQRSGVHYEDSDSRAPTSRDCPDGVVFRGTKYLGPFNYPDCHLLNVAKLKTHAMGLTLCVKNLQGTNIQPYIQFCGGLQNAIAQDFQPDARRHVNDLYAKHQRAGIPRWDTEKGNYMEMWVHRTIDSYSLIRSSVLLNIIEGVDAQNGNGFTRGPGPNGEPEIFMTNVLIFGKDAFRVDIIGHWLAGHEPGNFGLFHLARERGVSTALNPHNIPVYRWEDSGPKLTPLDQFARTPLTTLYLAKRGEPRFHLCNEPFAYPAEPLSACLSGGKVPGLRVLGQVKPAKGPSSLLIEYNLPADGDAALEMYEVFGERVGVLARGWTRRGLHLADWSTQGTAPGLYCCQLMAHGVTVARAAWL
jgi:hypothetical protein